MNLRATLLSALAAACLMAAPVSAQQWDPDAVAYDPYNDTYTDTRDFVAPDLYDDTALEAGYWVIVGSVPMHDPVAWERAGRNVRARAAACGLVTQDDLSDHFEGFVPGYNVFLVGPYDKSQALAVRDAAQRCIPDTYVKYGTYIGL